MQEGMAHRVIFLGDSITEHWIIYHAQFFSVHAYLDRGIFGQTTPQMLLRFRSDVIALRPQAVVILAGTNDLAGNTGPETIEFIEGNLMSMVELGNANHLRVVLSSVLPVTDAYQPRTNKRRPADIRALNQWMKTYCARGICTYADYFDSMTDERGLLRSDLTNDGLHPNVAGYDIMEPIVENAIKQALTQP
jgi:lysophospholipase L1-like esterase